MLSSLFLQLVRLTLLLHLSTDTIGAYAKHLMMYTDDRFTKNVVVDLQGKLVQMNQGMATERVILDLLRSDFDLRAAISSER